MDFTHSLSGPYWGYRQNAFLSKQYFIEKPLRFTFHKRMNKTNITLINIKTQIEKQKDYFKEGNNSHSKDKPKNPSNIWKKINPSHCVLSAKHDHCCGFKVNLNFCNVNFKWIILQSSKNVSMRKSFTVGSVGRWKILGNEIGLKPSLAVFWY